VEQLLWSKPAGRRLRWLLDGLNGEWSPAVDGVSELAPEFASMVLPERFVLVMRERAARIAPIRLVGLDVETSSAVARFRAADGDLWVARIEVEPDSPHRIVRGYAELWVPDYLTPALPKHFAAHMPSDVDLGKAAEGGVLVVFSGVPGSGKSTLAMQVGLSLDISVFSGDWLLGALSPFGMRHRDDLMEIAEELLVTLAYGELSSGRSVIVDWTTEDAQSWQRWESLAAAFGVRFEAVTCSCSDRKLHRGRVEHRLRSIPGWQDAGDWPDVESRMRRAVPWPGSTAIDTAEDLQSCLAQLLRKVVPEHS
jgi:predicted kinase